MRGRLAIAGLAAGAALLPLAGAPSLRAQAPRYQPAVEAVESGVRQGLYPGAVIVVGRKDTILLARGVGRTSWERGAPAPLPEGTWWDLASLTKVVATTGALAVLVDAGRVDLDAPVARYLPRFTGDGRDAVSVRMLLDHTSGLRAWAPLWREAPTREAAIALLYAERPARRPGGAAVYSDLNAILLGLLVEAVTGRSLDDFVAEAVLGPLGMTRTAFSPGLPAGAPVAPSRMRGGRPAPGEVHDDNARRLGGVAGHAGLFGTGLDLARYAQAWLRLGAGPERRWISEATARRFLLPSPAGGRRALGWDRPERRGGEPSVFGTLAGEASYGHTGWTGTMLWIDPARDLFLVLLTNRSLDSRVRRSLTAMREVRTEVSDRALRAALADCAAAGPVAC